MQAMNEKSSVFVDYYSVMCESIACNSVTLGKTQKKVMKNGFKKCKREKEKTNTFAVKTWEYVPTQKVSHLRYISESQVCALVRFPAFRALRDAVSSRLSPG